MLLLFSPILFAWAGEILESEIHHYVFDDTDTEILAVNFSDLREPLDYIGTHCLKITQNVAVPIFVLLKLTCLVTLFDRKLQVFKNSPKWTIFGIFN